MQLRGCQYFSYDPFKWWSNNGTHTPDAGGFDSIYYNLHSFLWRMCKNIMPLLFDTSFFLLLKIAIFISNVWNACISRSYWNSRWEIFIEFVLWTRLAHFFCIYISYQCDLFDMWNVLWEFSINSKQTFFSNERNSTNLIKSIVKSKLCAAFKIRLKNTRIIHNHRSHFFLKESIFFVYIHFRSNLNKALIPTAQRNRDSNTSTARTRDIYGISKNKKWKHFHYSIWFANEIKGKSSPSNEMGKRGWHKFTAMGEGKMAPLVRFLSVKQSALPPRILSVSAVFTIHTMALAKRQCTKRAN